MLISLIPRESGQAVSFVFIKKGNSRLHLAGITSLSEMIPIVDTPVIQYVVEEAVQSGITDILIIIGKGNVYEYSKN